jgi:hypothetical protein
MNKNMHINYDLTANQYAHLNDIEKLILRKLSLLEIMIKEGQK